jgi:hypothetical protein
MRKTLLILAAIMMLGTIGFAQDDKKSDKLTSDELVAKHLASIGTPEDIAAVKTLILSGDGTLVSNYRSSVTLTGQSQFGSEGNKLVFAIVFNSNEYPYDKIAYDGKSQTVGYPNGGDSTLSNFLKAQNAITKYGFFGGALSTAWALEDVKGRKIKLDSPSLTKVDGKQLYKIKYSPGDELRISLYFEPETFRHVMTEYEYTIQAGLISRDPTANSSAKQSTYKMKEMFGDFKTAGKLTLPHEYTIYIDTINPNSGSKSLIWHINYKDVYFNEPLPPGTFKVG